MLTSHDRKGAFSMRSIVRADSCMGMGFFVMENPQIDCFNAKEDQSKQERGAKRIKRTE
jgi:hypothetical protein